MATLATQVVSLTGLDPAPLATASAGGDKCATGAGVVLYVKNDHTSSWDVTIATPGTVDGLAVADRTVTVANGTIKLIPVTDRYRNPSDGLASISYTGVTALSVAVIRV